MQYILQLHRLPDDPETEDNDHLPIMPHSSQLKTKAACNCGRKQADKEDPFDHKVLLVVVIQPNFRVPLVIVKNKKDPLDYKVTLVVV